MNYNVYLDESGDLGWKFDKPFRNGGSSRFLTIAYIICPQEKKHLPKRIVKSLYNKIKANPSDEIKGSSLGVTEKEFIVKELVKLLNKNPDIKISYITVSKEKVAEHIRVDSNLIYNYMIRLSLLKEIEAFDTVNLIRDNRSVKIKSGNTLINYLQTELIFSHSSTAKLVDIPSDSKSFKNLILADWINNIVWGKYEDSNNVVYKLLRTHINSNRLYF